MKTIFKLQKSVALLMFFSLFILGASCNDKKSEKNLKDQIDKLEDDENFAGSSKREDICELLNKDDIMEVFALSEENELKQKSSHGTICQYDWSINKGTMTLFSASLNFARGGQHTNSQIGAIWEGQNNGVYKKWNPKEVSGVGDKASWTDLGGGQLRVTADGYIFYVSLSIMYGNKDLMDKNEKIEKTKILAKRVIERM